MTDVYFHPWGTATPDFWLHPQATPRRPTHPPRQPPGDSPIPAAFHPQVVAINAAIRSNRLAEAAAAATLLDEQITAACGEAHPHTANVRDLRSYIRHLAGDHEYVCNWCATR